MLSGDRVRSLRLRNNYSHQRLADALGLNIRQIARYESGEVDASGAVIANMADVFNVSTDYLLGRSDDPTPCAEAGKLTPKESAILSAVRRGERLEAIKAIISDE